MPAKFKVGDLVKTTCKCDNCEKLRGKPLKVVVVYDNGEVSSDPDDDYQAYSLVNPVDEEELGVFVEVNIQLAQYPQRERRPK